MAIGIRIGKSARACVLCLGLISISVIVIVIVIER